MQVVILAGGRGQRLGALGRPKALARIGDHSVLWHVIQRYRAFGFDDVLVALGHQARTVRDDLRHDFPKHRRESGAAVTTLVHPDGASRIQLVDTGAETATAGRLQALRPRLASNRPFFLNWTDVLSDIDYHRLASAHRDSGAALTFAAVRPPARFGRLELEADGRVTAFAEKQPAAEGWINAGTCVLSPSFYRYLERADESFETGPVPRAIAAGDAHGWRHEGFWQCMDYPHEHRLLDELWHAGKAPWTQAPAEARQATR